MHNWSSEKLTLSEILSCYEKIFSRIEEFKSQGFNPKVVEVQINQFNCDSTLTKYSKQCP